MYLDIKFFTIDTLIEGNGKRYSPSIKEESIEKTLRFEFLRIISGLYLTCKYFASTFVTLDWTVQWDSGETLVVILKHFLVHIYNQKHKLLVSQPGKGMRVAKRRWYITVRQTEQSFKQCENILETPSDMRAYKGTIVLR